MHTEKRLPFASDYQQGAHPRVLERLVAANMEANAGYGMDAHSEHARKLIRDACSAPQAEVHFLVGGTQANAVTIDALLAPWQGVVAASSGHVSVHEAGAIEACGHKVIQLPERDGKLGAANVDALAKSWEQDENREHMVMPGLVYISQPTEYGTLYSLRELSALRTTCDKHDMRLYVDGARLAYALAAPANDVALADLARLADAFYVGGTKCGALLGEAVVFPRPETCPHFFTLVKRRGALLAKGMITGIQFETLFSDGLYQQIGQRAIVQAGRIARAFDDPGCELMYPQQTNQVFVALDEKQYVHLSERVEMSFWERLADGRTVVRLATSWASSDEDVDAFVALARGI
ncbi:L-threonine aldolase [Olsenella sp. KH3B4]|uniref:threonine aldolase family protein n=1 Tax=Olsenella sp. KH3B4 TaxID=1855394 RepID=UPI0008CC75D7|nr:aminotransferase class I/II-fold pyridoxal phosphate-dependent enzyme [Olsenella sp. KH3B4]SES85080.1 L-threonine aldolase [Olsenella sp. KH3B4]